MGSLLANMSIFTHIKYPEKGWVVQPFFNYLTKKGRERTKLLRQLSMCDRDALKDLS